MSNCQHGGYEVRAPIQPAQLLRSKEMGYSMLTHRTTPLRFLDLPLDLLQAIIKEVTHTNDLTSLALTHSTLHALVIPQIYSRFDIVWPDASPTVETRVGVDALTYGLATLVMSQDVFGEGLSERLRMSCSKCGSSEFCQHQSSPQRPRKTRRGNHFANFTRKFSLGNGPEDWVKEYLITKEGGKMLGTLVALAVGRMRNLESFTWDMPTGVLRDVWLALASLDDRGDGHECHLERIWVRWHDNQDALISPPIAGASPGLTNLPHLMSSYGIPRFQIPSYPRVEFPTFSVLPPLKSLNVLDIDELSYVEEMSVLLERSLSRLNELRVGLAHHAQGRPWARPREDRTLVPPPLTHSAEPMPRKGGILGILVSRFCPAFNDTITETSQIHDAVNQASTLQTETTNNKDVSVEKTAGSTSVAVHDDVSQLGALLAEQHLNDQVPRPLEQSPTPNTQMNRPNCTIITVTKTVVQAHNNRNYVDEKRLVLETLELERICLSIPVLCTALDWSRLRTLTILGCRDHELLWKALRKMFTPPTQSKPLSKSKSSLGTDIRTSDASDVEYKLCITRIHTDAVSAALLAFLKDTLAPDTLEYLFLQQSLAYKSVVTIDQIYKHAIRRHRSSLKKLLIDSDIRAADGSPDGNTNWRRWAVSRDLITCITSGRMHLRELSISIDYKDWHYFLQRLPFASTLRSLHIKHIADYVHNRVDAREAANQVLDIVALRPELELCYLGIQGKCFEILEFSHNRKAPPTPQEALETMSQPHLDDDDISDDHDEQDHDINDADSDDFNLNTDQEDADETDDEAQQGRSETALRLREILFYDDKISIFKARHGRL